MQQQHISHLLKWNRYKKDMKKVNTKTMVKNLFKKINRKRMMKRNNRIKKEKEIKWMKMIKKWLR